VRFLFLFFIVTPLVEMMLLFEVADVIGGLSTIAMVVATAAIGVQVLKRQGISTLMRANQRLESGQLPAQEIVEGMLLAAAGALLLTPGFITDTLGFIFLTSPLRRSIASKVVKSGVVKAMSSSGGGVHFSSVGSQGFNSSQGFKKGFGGQFGAGHFHDPVSQRGRGDENVYEGEFTEENGLNPTNVIDHNDTEGDKPKNL